MIGNSPTILLVDDEEKIRSLLSEHFVSTGYSVIIAQSGDDAVPLVESTVIIDLIITDIRMPGSTNGFDLIEHARHVRPGVRTIAMSGYVGGESDRIAVADKFLAKPFTLNALDREVHGLLSGERTSVTH